MAVLLLSSLDVSISPVDEIEAESSNFFRKEVVLFEGLGRVDDVMTSP